MIKGALKNPIFETMNVFLTVFQAVTKMQSITLSNKNSEQLYFLLDGKCRYFGDTCIPMS